MPSFVVDYLIDQDQSSGGGSLLPPVSTGWDTNIQFVLRVAAPAGHKIQIRPPAGRSVHFGGFLMWESLNRGGSSPVGPVSVSFAGLEGTPPDFAGSDAVLSDAHGYFGFWEITSSGLSSELAFTSMTLTGTVTPQYTGFESLYFVAHRESSLQVAYSGTDEGQFVSIVPEGGAGAGAPLALKIQPADAGNVMFKWPSQVGASYQLQVNTSLSGSTWENCGPVHSGTGNSIEWTCEKENGSRVFRLIKLP